MVFNWIDRGDNITYHMTENYIVVESTKKETLSNAITFLQDVHRLLETDVEIIKNRCILSEAYVNAVLDWNDGEASMIPSRGYVMHHLRKIVNRYIKAGYVFDKDWLDAIFK